MEYHSKILIFELNKQLFAVDSQQVLSIEKSPNVTVIPGAANFIKGIAEFHGVPTPIVNLKNRLQMEEIEQSIETQILLVATEGFQIGLMVDGANEVREIDDTLIQTIPPLMRGENKSFLKGIIKLDNELTVFLDLQQILSFEDLKEVKEVIDD